MLPQIVPTERGGLFHLSGLPTNRRYATRQFQDLSITSLIPFSFSTCWVMACLFVRRWLNLENGWKLAENWLKWWKRIKPVEKFETLIQQGFQRKTGWQYLSAGWQLTDSYAYNISDPACSQDEIICIAKFLDDSGTPTGTYNPSDVRTGEFLK